MNAMLKIALAAAGLAAASPAAAQVVFYENEGFQGRSFTTEKQVADFQRSGFNDRASSVVVLHDQWEVCESARFGGKCIVLRAGRYPSLAAMGMNDRVSSARIVAGNARIDAGRYAPAPLPVYDNHRRRNERVYQAPVTSARAVLATSGRRCWVERDQYARDRGDANIGGAMVGALLGGILGHQVGSGRGNDAATAAGALAGAAIGANVGRDDRNVERCASVPGQARAEYWDVTYTFKGVEHRIQTAVPPGNTIPVNAQGEPRA
jgi:uncharacterized protein YcfJ